MYTVQKGFTLIELVMVMVVIGILAATAIPRYVENSVKAEADIKYNASRSVKNAMVGATGNTETFPDIVKLASFVEGEGVAAKNSGVEVKIEGDLYTVPTYTDTNCIVATTSKNDIVKCVGSVP